MTNNDSTTVEYGSPAHRLEEAFACHAVEGMEATAEHRAMFAMFEAKGWTDEQCTTYLIEQLQQKSSSVFAAE
ncbi:MAG: hypothetical protein COA58_16725 [Bacteroidetes bacterium]|nr:MAG: hypothetical protein COA58_16725 [Bacteroidota bacterium]